MSASPLGTLAAIHFFLRFAICATSAGPNAYVSIAALPDWSNGHSCMAGCVWYNGLYKNNPVVGGHDLGHGLDCGGDSAINGCYCRPDTLPKARTYISSCVSSACGNNGVQAEISSAISIYDGYCSTVAREQSTTSETAAAASTGSVSAATSSTLGSSTTRNAPATQTGVSVATVASAGDNKSDGLDKSDLIALGVGLGIGIPSLLIGLATCILMRRRKNDRQSKLVNDGY
jgi:hypothetical protein